MRITGWAVVLLYCTNVAQAVPVLSGPIFDPANGRQYYLLDKSTWSAAESQAVAMGGHLATIRNQSENDFVFNTFSHFAGEPRDLWIGLSDAGHEGTFTWSSGLPLTFSNFQINQPDNGAGDPTSGAENYVHMNTQRGARPHVTGWIDGKWNDFQDVDSYTYFGGIATQTIDGVVETPEPGAISLVAIGVMLVSRRTRRK